MKLSSALMALATITSLSAFAALFFAGLEIVATLGIATILIFLTSVLVEAFGN